MSGWQTIGKQSENNNGIPLILTKIRPYSFHRSNDYEGDQCLSDDQPILETSPSQPPNGRHSAQRPAPQPLCCPGRLLNGCPSTSSNSTKFRTDFNISSSSRAALVDFSAHDSCLRDVGTWSSTNTQDLTRQRPLALCPYHKSILHSLGNLQKGSQGINPFNRFLVQSTLRLLRHLDDAAVLSSLQECSCCSRNKL